MSFSGDTCSDSIQYLLRRTENRDDEMTATHEGRVCSTQNTPHGELLTLLLLHTTWRDCCKLPIEFMVLGIVEAKNTSFTSLPSVYMLDLYLPVLVRSIRCF